MESYINFGTFDIYSKKICFFYNNQEKMGSYFGFFLTLVYIFASLILFILQIIKAIQREELKVYDTTIYSQEMPIIDVDIKQFYFAFGLEYPNTATRYIDEGIYTAQITFYDKQKINDIFKDIVVKDLEFEKCNVDNFGKDYQDLFVKNELNNSYCLKNFNYSLTFAGSYKYDRITYIRIIIKPCVNSTKNNYTCKPQELIDKRLNSGYFSIVIKDFGLNPSNFTYPKIPTLQDLYTTIDKRLSKNYIVNFGITEIHTDTGLINEMINKEKYLQFRKVLETFSVKEEKDYNSGKLILAQLRLEDTLFVQKRTYMKISDIFSKIGGYMQLMNTVFLLVTSIINKLNSEIKIINSIFNFNIKDNKMILKCKSFKNSNKIMNYKYNKKNSNSIFSSNKGKNNLTIESINKSKNNFINKDNDLLNISSINNTNNNKNESKYYTIKKSRNENMIILDNNKKNSSKAKIEKFQNGENNIYNFYNICSNVKNIEECNNMNFNDNINLTIFDIFCTRKTSKKYKSIKLFNKGNSFYRKQMDIVHVFTLLSIIEEMISK